MELTSEVPQLRQQQERHTHQQGVVICRLVMYRTKGTYVLYDGTYGTSNQGQMLDV